MSLQKILTYIICIGLFGTFVLFVIPCNEDNKQAIKFVDEPSLVILKSDDFVINDSTGVGIISPTDVDLEYPTDVRVPDPTGNAGYMLLGVDVETLDYIPLRMDVDGYIMCKDVNKAIFKLVLREGVSDKSPEELIELIKGKEE